MHAYFKGTAYHEYANCFKKCLLSYESRDDYNLVGLLTYSDMTAVSQFITANTVWIGFGFIDFRLLHHCDIYDIPYLESLE